LPDHGIESEACHRRNAHTLTPRLRIEDLRRNDPAQRPTRTTEAEIVNPSYDDEPPSRAFIPRLPWWKLSEQNRRDNERHHIPQVSEDEWPPPSGLVDEQDT